MMGLLLRVIFDEKPVNICSKQSLTGKPREKHSIFLTSYVLEFFVSHYGVNSKKIFKE